MKKKIKKISFILLIILITFISLFLIGLAYLFLFPNSQLFGVTYAKDSSRKAYSLYEYTVDELQEINVTTLRYDINVSITEEYNNIHIYVYNDISAFTKKSNANNETQISYLAQNKSLNIFTDEIEGALVNSRSSNIKILIPKNLINQNLSVNLNSSTKSNISFMGIEELNLGALSVKVHRGDVKIDKIQVNELSITAYRSKIMAGEGLNGKINKLVLNAGSSQVDFTRAGNGRNILNENKENETPDYSAINFDIGKLYINDAQRKSVIQVFRCDELLSDTGYIVNSGKLEMYFVDYMNINVVDFDILLYSLTNISGLKESVFNSSGKGSLTVYNCDSILNANTDEGNIDIYNPKNFLSLESYKGNINVYEAEKEISVASTYGDININYKENTEDNHFEYTNTNKYRYISSLRTKFGKVKVVNINKINIEIEDGGDAKIFLDFDKVIDPSEIIARGANLTIVVPKDEEVKISVVGDNANLKVDVGTLTRENSTFTGTYNGEAYGHTQTNEINIKNLTGNAELYSDNIYAIY